MVSRMTMTESSTSLGMTKGVARNDKLWRDLMRSTYAEVPAVAAAPGSVTIKPS